MPQWGFTSEMRQTKPWGLSEWWLEPSKVTTDPIHGDIYTTRLEQHLIDTAPFQRLRRIRQLGTTHLVYPGATHSRFSHALGALRVTQDLLDHVLQQRYSHHSVKDLFSEWSPFDDVAVEAVEAVEAVVDADVAAAEPTVMAAERRRFVQRVSEATVLARLGALLHDIGHVSFGHTVEDDLGLLVGHDANTVRFAELWDEMIAEVKARKPTGAGAKRALADISKLEEGGELHRHLRPLILSKEPQARAAAREKGETPPPAPEPLLTPEEIRFPFIADMVGNTICADLLDYLVRDHRFAGLPISLGGRYLSAFYVTADDGGGLYQQRMALLIHRQGRQRADVVTEVLKHLRYRYELQERVLSHHAKIAADAMLGRMLELYREGIAQVAPDDRPLSGRRQRLAKVQPAARRSALARDWLVEHLEDLLLTHGDDGLLEHVSSVEQHDNPELARAGDLARRLLDRRLYEHAAKAVDAFAQRDLYARWGTPAQRRSVERQAAEYAHLDPEKIIVWLPPPGMRLKLAEVLVDHGKGISPFKDWSKLGSDIYEAHERLWTVSLLVDRSLTESNKLTVAAKLARLMGLCWDTYERQLGPSPSDWPLVLAAMQVCAVDRHEGQAKQLVDEYLAVHGRARGRGASDEPKTHEALTGEMKQLRRRRPARR